MENLELFPTKLYTISDDFRRRAPFYNPPWKDLSKSGLLLAWNGSVVLADQEDREEYDSRQNCVLLVKGNKDQKIEFDCIVKECECKLFDKEVGSIGFKDFCSWKGSPLLILERGLCHSCNNYSQYLLQLYNGHFICSNCRLLILKGSQIRFDYGYSQVCNHGPEFPCGQKTLPFLAQAEAYFDHCAQLTIETNA